MTRTTWSFPNPVHFTTQLEVRIGDINYGGHLGNDKVLSLAQEARVQMLRSMGYSELDVEGPGIIMNEAEIKYVKEAFAGDILTVDLHVGNFSAVGCSIYYNIRIIDKVIAVVRTGIVFYDYNSRKVVRVPSVFQQRFNDNLA
ncbi:MAG: thioesterase family protein [Chitinophagales bacterium]|nr:thioesterase family protein [Chitinophagales bacterium]MCB9020659.1 thioesterase family protein [Chitinophagales bacterium]HQU38706.1 thioesterase family protein [Chitinophagales bacterium]